MNYDNLTPDEIAAVHMAATHSGNISALFEFIDNKITYEEFNSLCTKSMNAIAKNQAEELKLAHAEQKQLASEGKIIIKEKFPGNELRQKIIAKLNNDNRFEYQHEMQLTFFRAKNVTLNKSMFGKTSDIEIVISVTPTFSGSTGNGFVLLRIYAHDMLNINMRLSTVFEGWLESEDDLDHILRMLGVPTV